MDEIALRLAARFFDQPLISNEWRGAFVEAMIEPYLTPYGWRYVGDGWSGWDFERDDGLRLEVKQSAAQQTWRNPPTRAIFDIAARTGYYEGQTWVPVAGRCSQIYVFAWNPAYGPETDHRNPDQWEFRVVSAVALPEGQRTISLSAIKRLADPISISGLGSTIKQKALSAG